MNEEPDLVGTMLGSYRITGELSRGGMGAVYRAEHSVLERTVAVKLLRPELTTNAELVHRFMNEARAASAIQHPGIIEVLDFGHSNDGRAYFVMEMLQGESLARRIQARGHVPPREAVQIARGIASALTAAHGRGIVHRDLKPDNVFLIPDPELGERPKVLDFGIAKLGDLAPNQTKYTQTGALMGTPFYIAPEQARAASAIDHRADLYSLGCMLYEMLVGEPPFVAVGAGEIIALQLFGVATRPSERVPGIPPALDQIVMKLLEKEPQDRFQSAGEVGNALDLVFDGPAAPRRHAPVTFDPPNVAGGVSQPAVLTTHHPAAKSRRGLAAGVIAIALAGAAIAAVVLTRGDDAKPAAEAAPPRDLPPVQLQAAPPPVEVAAPPVEQSAPPEIQPAVVKPKREKPRRDQKGSGDRSKYTESGSPIETELD
jgi:serine/threonine protein kinase